MDFEVRRFWVSLGLFVPILLVSLLFWLTSDPASHPIAYGAFLFMAGIYFLQEYRISKLRVRLRVVENPKSTDRASSN